MNHPKDRDGYGRVIGSGLHTKEAGGAVDLSSFQDVLYGLDGKIAAARNQIKTPGTAAINSHAKGYQYDDLKRLKSHSILLSSSRNDFIDNRLALWSGSKFDTLENVEPNPAATTFNAVDNLTGVSADEYGRSYSATFDDTRAGSPPQSVNGDTIALDSYFRTIGDTALIYEYDNQNRLVAVRKQGHIGAEMEMLYDGFGRRRYEAKRETKTGNVVGRHLEYLGANVVIEHDGFTVTFATTHGPGIDAPMAVSTGPSRAATAKRLITNVRGDVIAALEFEDSNASAERVPFEEAVLSPWGERSIYDGAAGCVEDSLSIESCDAVILNRFGIGGARADVSTKLVDLRNRVYAPHLRGFLTPDPLGDVDSQGLWNYVAGDPINFVDPLGLRSARITCYTSLRGSGCHPGGAAPPSSPISGGGPIELEGGGIAYPHGGKKCLSECDIDSDDPKEEPVGEGEPPETDAQFEQNLFDQLMTNGDDFGDSISTITDGKRELSRIEYNALDRYSTHRLEVVQNYILTETRDNLIMGLLGPALGLFKYARFGKGATKSVTKGTATGFDAMLQTARLAKRESSNALTAELRVAKALVRGGVNVTFRKAAKDEKTSDLLVNGIRTEVKRSTNFANLATNLANGVEQVGDGGLVILVRGADAGRSMAQFTDFVANFRPALDVAIVVVEETTLPIFRGLP